jgi:hypothetical protein
VILLSLLVIGWLLSPWGPTAATGPTPADLSTFEGQTGVRITRVAITGQGGLVDLRYLVIDPQKAQAVHESLYLVDENSGEVVSTLFMGHAPMGDPKAGYSYPVLFVNEQGLITSGGRVSIVVSNFRLEHVPVQ